MFRIVVWEVKNEEQRNWHIFLKTIKFGLLNPTEEKFLLQLTFLASQNELCIYNDWLVHTPGYVYVQGVEGETCEANKTEPGLEDGGGEDSAHVLGRS